MIHGVGPFRRTAWHSRPGGSCNEDAAGGGSGWLYVLDGATGLTGGAPVMDAASDAAWLARETARWLDRHLPDSGRTLEDILAEGMDRLRGQWKGPEDTLPSAGIALFRARGAVVEYFGLGDCAASLQKTDGSMDTWEEQALRRLDANALQQAQALAARKGCSLRQAMPGIRDILQAHRALRNTPQGYWILDPTGQGIPHARRAEVPLQECRSLFLCTDGLAQCIGFGLADSLSGLHRRVQRDGLQPLFDQLDAQQQDDLDLQRLPRFKWRDDASGAFCWL